MFMVPGRMTFRLLSRLSTFPFCSTCCHSHGSFFWTTTTPFSMRTPFSISIGQSYSIHEIWHGLREGNPQLQRDHKKNCYCQGVSALRVCPEQAP
jgi:hypothetical protein